MSDHLNVSLLPVAIVLELIVASKCDKSTKTDSKRPVDLSGSVDPNLNKVLSRLNARVS